jgi:hypothetical protein
LFRSGGDSQGKGADGIGIVKIERRVRGNIEGDGVIFGKILRTASMLCAAFIRFSWLSHLSVLRICVYLLF